MKKYITTFLSLFLVGSLYADNFNQIKKLGVLRVGTTGDYAPMSYWNPVKKIYQGFDIEMAESLGKYLGLKIEFIRTDWQTLTKDLFENKFDIAMSGICGTKERARDFLFTDSVMETGKVPLVLKINRDKFKTMEDIDQPNIKVVANNGGTNMKFALANIKKALILIVPENRMNFEYILDKKADVFFTDRIEALYKEKSNSKLVAIDSDNPMDKMQMVYLISKKDKKLQNEVNKWLKKIKDNGEYKKFLENALIIKY